MKKIKNSLMKFKNSLLIAGLAGLMLFSGLENSVAQQAVLATNLAPGTTQVFLTNPAYISGITVTAGTFSTNTASNNPQTLIFFDSATTNTNNIISNTWYSRQSYTTNTTNVLTNGVGQVYTNIYIGQWTVIVTNLGSTNSLPALQYLAVPPVSVVNRQTRIQAVNGLNAIVPAGMSNATITIYYAYPF